MLRVRIPGKNDPKSFLAILHSRVWLGKLLLNVPESDVCRPIDP